jgi:hypothetical protein
MPQRIPAEERAKVLEHLPHLQEHLSSLKHGLQADYLVEERYSRCLREWVIVAIMIEHLVDQEPYETPLEHFQRHRDALLARVLPLLEEWEDIHR